MVPQYVIFFFNEIVPRTHVRSMVRADWCALVGALVKLEIGGGLLPAPLRRVRHLPERQHHPGTGTVTSVDPKKEIRKRNREK